MVEKKFRATSTAGLTISVQSFSYAKGLPQQADLVFDVRFLANPHYQADLRDQTGQDQPVADYISTDPALQPFLDRTVDLLAWLLPHYQQEGKSYLDIALGCTGGRHRSVFVTEEIGKLLGQKGFAVRTAHRDI